MEQSSGYELRLVGTEAAGVCCALPCEVRLADRRATRSRPAAARSSTRGATRSSRPPSCSGESRAADLVARRRRHRRDSVPGTREYEAGSTGAARRGAITRATDPRDARVRRDASDHRAVAVRRGLVWMQGSMLPSRNVRPSTSAGPAWRRTRRPTQRRKRSSMTKALQRFGHWNSAHRSPRGRTAVASPPRASGGWPPIGLRSEVPPGRTMSYIRAGI